MRRIWLGGSFNPIHHGHLLCARAVAETAGFEKVVLVPSGTPPHKRDDPNIADPVHRLAMCKLSIEGCDLFEVDDLELGRVGASYTIDTVRLIRDRGEPEVTWLIGADMLNILPSWHQAEELAAEARFVVMARPGWTMDWERLPSLFRQLQSQVVSAPLVDISATDIRRRVAAGKSISYLTPPSVAAYISRNGLYQ